MGKPSIRKRLTVQEAREMLGWHGRSDSEVEEFLSGLRTWIDRFLDDYFEESG